MKCLSISLPKAICSASDDYRLVCKCTGVEREIVDDFGGGVGHDGDGKSTIDG